MKAVYLRIVFVFTDLVLPLVVGYVCKQKGWLGTQACNILIKLNIVFLCTLLSFFSFWVLPLSWQLLWLPLLGILFTVVPGFLGWLIFSRRFTNYLEKGSYVVSCLLSNIGTLGGLCAFILYGEVAYAYVQLIATLQNMLLVILCFPIAQYYAAKQTAKLAKTTLHLSFKEMFLTWNQVPVLGMVAGILLQLGGVTRPQSLEFVFKNLVHIGAWIALLPVGYLVDFGRAKEYYHRVLDMLLLRFVIVPSLFYIFMKNLFTDQILLGTLLIVSAAPAAINSVLTAKLYELQVDLSIASFLLTTAVYVLVLFPAFFFYVAGGGSF